jgi:DNA-binding PadR family transcriptional regulator
VAVREALLALLAEEPGHGYELKARFERRTAGAWPVNVGQVYTTLGRLERDGLVASDPAAADERRSYRITEAGREAVRSWYATPLAPDAMPRDDLAAKVLLAAEAPDVDLAGVLTTERAAAMGQLQGLARLRAERAGTSPALDGLIELYSLRVEADMRWLDAVERRAPGRAHTTTEGARA